jgi:hypothetical protein
MPRVGPADSSKPWAEDLALVQYWDAEEVPEYIAAELASFADLNPGFRHLVFSEGAAAEFIAEHFTSREVAAFRSCAVASMQSDYLRFCAGLVLGGVYSDVDFRCIAPLAPVVPDPEGLRLFRGPRGNVISGFFAFRSPGHPFLQLALEIVTANIERRFPDSVYFATGPPIFASLVGLHETGSLDGLIERRKNPRVREALRAYWRVIGDFERITAALSGVEVLPHEEYLKFVRPASDLAYKTTESHWLNVKGDIFRAR